MPRLARLFGVAAVIAVAAWLIYAKAWMRLRCNMEIVPIYRSTQRLPSLSNVAAATHARRNIEQLLRCRRHDPTNQSVYLLLGANYRVHTNYDAAIAAYETALRYDHRPEVYFELGQTLLSAGRREEALQVLLKVAHTGAHLSNINDAEIRQKMLEELAKREEYLRSRIARD